MRPKDADRSVRALRLLVSASLTVWVIILAFYLLIYREALPEAMFANDFVAFWTGASLVRDGQGSKLYDLDAQQAFQIRLRQEQAIGEGMREATGRIPFWNPPAMALLVIPFTVLPVFWGYVVWTAVGLLLTLFAVGLPLRGHRYRGYVVTLLLGFGAFAATLTQGQVNWVFLLSLSLGLLALGKGRPCLGGILLGLLWLKPQYALLFPLVFLLKGRWRELSGMVGMGLLLGAISLAIIGPDGVQMYLQSMAIVSGFHDSPGTAVCPIEMVNWRALLLSIWPEIPEVVGRQLLTVLGVATVLLSLPVWRGPWDATSSRFPRQVLVLLLATIIAIPHSHFHGMLLLLAPVALMVAKSMDGEPWHRASIAILVGGYLLFFTFPPFRAPFSLLLSMSAIAVLTIQTHMEREVVSSGRQARNAGC